MKTFDKIMWVVAVTVIVVGGWMTYTIMTTGTLALLK